MIHFLIIIFLFILIYEKLRRNFIFPYNRKFIINKYHLTKFVLLDYIYFKCDDEGNWFKNQRGFEWANYTNCFNAILPLKERMINLNIICHSIALIMLITGLIIFFSYK
jgi:hypothetical protein